MGRNTYRVFLDGMAWRVEGPQVDSWFETKAQAIDAGRRLSVYNMPSQLVIQRQNGETEVEHIYGDMPLTKPQPRSRLERHAS